MPNTNIYYVYKLVHILNGSFYFGSRKSSHIDPYLDLGIKYFSSSKLVKEIRFTSFYFCVLETFDNFETCYWAEQNYIKTHITDNLCLNKSFYDKESGDRIFSMCGKKQTIDHIKKRTSHRKGVKTNKKISIEQQTAMQQGKIKKYPNGYKHSNISNEKNRLAHLGKQDSDETKLKKSNSAKGKPKPWLKNKKLSRSIIDKQNESRKKNRESWSKEKKDGVNSAISNSLKGKKKLYKTACSKPFLCRISDKKVLNKGNSARIFPELKQFF